MAAQAMASIGVVNGSLHVSGGSRRATRVSAARSGLLSVKAQQQPQQQTSDEVQASSRRAVLGLVATTLVGGSLAPAALAVNDPIKIGPIPQPSGGLPGTLNADEARDLDLKLKDRFYLQPKSVDQAVARAKESLKEIVSVKSSIDKKAWPYVMNDLRLRATYLRYDLNTIISGKPKDEKKDLKELSQVLFTSMDNLDHAAKVKSPKDAEKYYAATVSALNNVLAKLG